MRDLMTSMRCPKGLQNRTGTRYLFEQSNRTAFCLLKLHHIEIKFAESSWMSNKTILEFRVFSLHVEFLRIPGKNHYCTKDYMRIYVCLPISVYTTISCSLHASSMPAFLIFSSMMEWHVLNISSMEF